MPRFPIRPLKKSLLASACLVTLATGLAAVAGACVAYRHQHAAAVARGGGAPGASTAVTFPASRPTREFRALADDAQLARVRGEVEEAKRNLAAKGRYACCVHPWCSECLLRHGECRCLYDLAEKGPCCGECTEAWVEGRGAVDGLEAEELLERKKKAVKDRKGCEHGHH